MCLSEEIGGKRGSTPPVMKKIKEEFAGDLAKHIFHSLEPHLREAVEVGDIVHHPSEGVNRAYHQIACGNQHPMSTGAPY